MSDKIINLQYTTIKDPLPDFIYRSLKSFSSGANTYRPQPEELAGKLAKKHKIPENMIYLTAGADEAIQMFIHAYGKNTFAFTPTYIVYSDAKEFGKKFNEVYSIKNNTFSISPDKIDNASLIFLANPNNPSGFTRPEKVMELIENNPRAIVVIDEAYGDFADLSVIDKVKNHENMAVLRSFSKGFSMAGNRVGYIIAGPDIIRIVKNKAQWSNVSYLSVGAALAALENEDYFRRLRDDIARRRDNFMNFLSEQNYSFLPSKINAVVMTFQDENSGARFVEFLAEKNIIVSLGNGNSNIGLDKSFVRIAIGNEEQMEKIREVIFEYSGKSD